MTPVSCPPSVLLITTPVVPQYLADWLCQAAAQGYLGTVHALLCAKADPNGSSCGHRALHYAAALGHVEIARVLMSYGADPACVDNHGRLASDVAAGKDRSLLLQLLSAPPSR